MPNYIITGTYRGTTERIDEAETATEARELANEYRLAFGPDWLIQIKQKGDIDE